MSDYEFDHSWEALTEPGRATRFFAAQAMPSLAAASSECDLDTAWWLAELSRLAYVGDQEVRRDALHAAGAELVGSFEDRSIAGSLVSIQGRSGRHATVLVFRGTQDLRNWMSNIDVRPASWPAGGLVHRGFVEALDRIWPAIERMLREVHDAGGSILVAGHSLGGALATLAAARIAARAPTALYTFGGPRVGDEEFGRSLAVVPVFRFVNDRDLVPLVPTPGPLLRFRHVGARRRMTGEGLTIAPGDFADLRDWFRRARRYFDGLSGRRWHEAPPPLADHAPINYVARLDRLRRS